MQLVDVEEGYQGQEGISGINVSDFYSTVIPFDLQQFLRYRTAFGIYLIMPVDILAWKVK